MVRPISSSRVLVWCGALLIGEIAGFAAGACGPFWILVGACTLFAGLFGYGYNLPGWRVAVVSLAGCTLALNAESSRSAVLDSIESTNRPSVVFITVEQVYTYGKSVSFTGNWKGINFRVRLKGGDVIPRRGEVWCCTGWVDRRPRDFRGRRRLYVAGKGTSAVLVSKPRRFSPPRISEYVKSKLVEASKAGLGPESAVAGAVNRAMLFGERGGIPRRTKETFTAAGVTHFFAVSGLHTGVVLAVIVFFLRLLHCPFRCYALVACPAIWAYVYMIGLPPSATRAAMMATLYLSAALFSRRADPLVAWAQTFLFFHVFSPSRLFDVGSLLSFTVMLGILLSDGFAAGMGWSPRARSALVMFSAWAFGVPVAAWVFGTFVPGALAANLVMMPLAGFAVAAGFIGALAGCFAPAVGAYFNNAAALASDAMHGVSWAVSKLPFANFDASQWTLFECISWYVLLVLAGAALYLRAERKDRTI